MQYVTGSFHLGWINLVISKLSKGEALENSLGWLLTQGLTQTIALPK